MQSCEEVERRRFEEVVRGECKTVGREVRYSGNRFYGLREDNSSYYYAKRSGKVRKSWTKMTVVVDVESQVILAEDVRWGPGNDGVVLRDV